MRFSRLSLFKNLYFMLAWIILQGELCLHAAAHSATAMQPSRKLVIAATSDFHGTLEPRTVTSSLDPNVQAAWGGIITYGSYLRILREKFPNQVLALDAGDMFQGPMPVNWSQGAVMIAAANALQLNAATIGNHEFDYGTDTLQKRIMEAHFPFIVLNVYNKNPRRSVYWNNTQGTMLFTMQGIKVGLLGFTTTSTANSTRLKWIQNLHFVAPLTLVKNAAHNLRAQGAELVILIGHIGGDCTKLDNPQDLSSCTKTGNLGEMLQLVSALPPGLVDIAIGGHTHRFMAHQIQRTLVVQSGYNGQYFSYIEAHMQPQPHKGLDLTKSTIHPAIPLCLTTFADGQCTQPEQAKAPVQPAMFLNKTIHPDTQVKEAVTPFIQSVDQHIHRPIHAVAPHNLDRREVSRLSAEGMQELVHSDFALQNYGGVRNVIAQGSVSYGDIYAAVPFENKLVRISLTGQQLEALVESMVVHAQKPLPEISRLSIKKIDDRHYQLFYKKTQKRIDLEQLYTVTMCEFLAEGGDGTQIVLKNLPPEHFHYYTIDSREGLIHALQQNYPETTH
jgi:5'-nucleotidase